MSAAIVTLLASPLVLLLLLSAAVPGAQAYHDGAPVDQCNAMMPSHQGATAQSNSNVPYTIMAAKASYYGGETISVNVSGSVAFRGLILQARDSSNNRVGTFTLDQQESMVKLLDCDNMPGTAVTHTSRDDKSSITVSWTAPMTSAGEVKFRATVVQTFNMFYMDLESAPLTYMEMPMDNMNNNMNDNMNNNMNDTMRNMNDTMDNMNNNNMNNNMNNAGASVAGAMTVILSLFCLSRLL